MGYMRQDCANLHDDGRKLRERISALFVEINRLKADVAVFHANLAEGSDEAECASAAVDEFDMLTKDARDAGKWIDRAVQRLPDPDSLNDGSDVVSMRRWANGRVL